LKKSKIIITNKFFNRYGFTDMKQEIRRNLKYKKILKKVLERQNSILKI
jgi:hypothetical protein